MNSLNRLQIIGNLTKDPEIKDVSSNKVATFCVATNHEWKNGDQKQSLTEYHNCVAWGKIAEIFQYIHKASKVYVDGRVQTRTWEKDGQKQSHTELIVNSIIFLDKAEKKEESTDDFDDLRDMW